LPRASVGINPALVDFRPASLRFPFRSYALLAMSFSHRCVAIGADFRLTRSSAVADGPRDASCRSKSCQLPSSSAETTGVVCVILRSAQCRINANRGPWQLFARDPLLTRDKDISKLYIIHAWSHRTCMIISIIQCEIRSSLSQLQ